MKIAILGVPGAGKTDLATTLADHFDLVTVDGYVEWVEEHYGWRLGRYASYAGSLALALERHARENAVQENFVTCGTMIETVTYQAAQQVDIEDDFDWRRQSGALVVLGAMVEDMFTYDFVFYLPSGTTDNYLSTIEQGLEEAIEVFAVPAVAVVEPREDVAAWVIEWIEGTKEMDEAAATE